MQAMRKSQRSRVPTSRLIDGIEACRAQRSRRPRVSEPEVDEFGWEVSCHVCGRSSGTLMECEFGLNGGDLAVCSRSYHVKCASLIRVPDGEFICPKHSDKPSHSEESASDSEYNYNGSDSSYGSDDSSSEEISSDADLGAIVNRQRKVRAHDVFSLNKMT
jgi:hypothetical protein